MAVIENRQPPAGAVTSVTRACRHKVAAGFARCRRAVVTARTGAGRDRTVVKGGRTPGGSGVAAVARRRGREVVAGFARCRRAIVTLRTGAGGDARAVECNGRHPGTAAVAAVARRRGREVVAGFARCRRAVVTADTRARCAPEAGRVVVKTGNAPYGGRVTQITLRAGWDVFRRFDRRRDTGSARVAADA
jgi:hypothetical protein